jgi:hypothetical protein
VRSWKGLTEILKVVRESDMDARAYSEFRDLVLQYAQSGGEAALREKINDVISALPQEKQTQIANAEKMSTTQGDDVEVHGRGLGNTRPAPFFATPARHEVYSVEVQTKPPQVQPPTVSVIAEPTSTSPRLQSAQDTESKSVPVTVTQEEPASRAVTPITPASPQPVSEPSRVSQTIAMAPVHTTDEYRARISEIKHTVNAQFGNPVHLMEGNNPVGREYMSALVASLKATGGSAPGTLTSAMQNLENAFQAVMQMPVTQVATVGERMPIQHEDLRQEVGVVPITISESANMVRADVPHSPAPTQDFEPEPEVPRAVPSPIPLKEVAPPSLPEISHTQPPSVSQEPALSNAQTILSNMPPAVQMPPQPPLSAQLPLAKAKAGLFRRLVPSILEDDTVEDEQVVAPAQAERPVAQNIKIPEPQTPVAPPHHIVYTEPSVKDAVTQPERSASPQSEIQITVLSKLPVRKLRVPVAPPQPPPVPVVQESVSEPPPPPVQPPVEMPTIKAPKTAPIHPKPTHKNLKQADIDRVQGGASVTIASRPPVRVMEKTVTTNPEVSLTDIPHERLPRAQRQKYIPPEVQEMIEEHVALRDKSVGLLGPAVTEGLENLLSEWNLFDESGLFGTGPTGIEHPLYIQLAPLEMSVVMSGRFEHASPDIVSSIRDYARAWQQEQGVAYSRDETFDHYLRRVVQRILKRQNPEH